jgi:hypothetical protein
MRRHPPCGTRVSVGFLVAVVVCGGCGARHMAATTSTQAPRPVQHRVLVDPAVFSPDGKRFASVRHVFVTSTGSVGYLDVGKSGTRDKRTVYSSSDSCCTEVTWVSPSLIAFDDDYNVKTVDLSSGRVHRVATFSNFSVSADGRWIAGWKFSGGHSPETIGVVSITGSNCRTVPKPKNADDSDANFSPDAKQLMFVRQRFDLKRGEDLGQGRVVTVSLSELRRPAANVLAC